MKLKPKLPLIILGLITLVIYLFTLSPTVRFWDTAEFTAVCWTLGIPHPPGFPLYVLAGRIFTLTGIFSPALSLNLFSALASVSAVIFLFLIFREIEFRSAIYSTLIPVLIFAFGGMLWTQAGRSEVYALAILLCEISLFLILRYRSTGELRFILASLYFAGICAVTHPPIAIGALIAIIDIGISVNYRWKRIGTIILMVFILLISLSLFLYLPIRGVLGPVCKWGEPENLKGFFTMISASEFMFTIGLTNINLLFERMSIIMRVLNANFTLILSPLIIFGIWRWRKQRFLFWILLVSIISVLMREELPYPDLIGYLLPISLALSLWLGAGLEGIFLAVDKFPSLNVFKRMKNVIFGVIILVMALPLIIAQYPRHNFNHNYWGERFGKDIMSPLPDSSLVIFNDINSYFICRYLQVAAGFRPDCQLVMLDALTGKSRNWYSKNLINSHKIKGLQDLPENKTEVFKQLVEANFNDRPIFCEYNEDLKVFNKYLEPLGLLYYIKSGEVSGVRSGDWKEFPEIKDFGQDREAALFYASRLYSKSQYYLDRGNLEKAEEYKIKALKLSSAF